MDANQPPLQQQSNEARDRSLPDKDGEDMQVSEILKEAKSIPLDQILKECAKSMDILATRPPSNQDLPGLIALDTKTKNDIFSPACVRYMKHHLSTFVDHLKIMGFDTSKINMDSPLGIPRVDPRFLTTTQDKFRSNDTSGQRLGKRSMEGGAVDYDSDSDRHPSRRKQKFGFPL